MKGEATDKVETKEEIDMEVIVGEAIEKEEEMVTDAVRTVGKYHSQRLNQTMK
jgi:hypothetical protein